MSIFFFASNFILVFFFVISLDSFTSKSGYYVCYFHKNESGRLCRFLSLFSIFLSPVKCYFFLKFQTEIFNSHFLTPPQLCFIGSFKQNFCRHSSTVSSIFNGNSFPTYLSPTKITMHIQTFFLSFYNKHGQKIKDGTS